MAAKYWIKLYHEIIHDPKMGRLPDRVWRRAIELFLIAGESGNDGILPSIEDMAWTLRVDPQELQADLEELEKVGIVILQDDMLPVVTNFAERQAPVSDAERMQQLRDRKRKAQYYGDEPVTNEVQGVTPPVTNRNADSDSDSDSDLTNGEAPSANADPPDTPSESPEPKNEVPTTFQEWHTTVKDSKNRPAVLRKMCETLYPGLDPPAYGYLGKVAKKVGGAGRLADLLWQHSSRPPTGDLLSYIQKVAKGNGNGSYKRNNGSSPPPGGDSLAEIQRKLADAFEEGQ